MDVIEKAKELTETISQDARCVRLQAARAAVETDRVLQNRLNAWNAEKSAFSTALRQQPSDKRELGDMQKKLGDAYDAIMAHPLMTELQAAQDELNALLTQINSMIQLTVSGEADCGGECARCPGCH